jgi:arylsulfatase A-like enzyme
MFHHFQENGYTCFAFSHNVYVNQLFTHFLQSIDLLSMPRDVPLIDHNFSDLFFFGDYATSIRSEISYLKYFGTPSNSLFLDTIGTLLRKTSTQSIDKQWERIFPRGVPQTEDVVCMLESTFDWVVEQLRNMESPYLAYVHLIPPHAPYRTRSEFVDRFDDGWKPISKPEHLFTLHKSDDELHERRRLYDEYILYVDAEFGRLYSMLDQEGILENTWLIFTSDHGEMFERGIFEHTTPTLYQAILRVPLLISEPGQNARQDIYSTTSSVDLLPTLSVITGVEGPAWSEGRVLPPFGDQAEDEERAVFAVEAKRNSRVGPLRVATVAMIKEPYKIIKYWGYPESEELVELYDLANDPDELQDLSRTRKPLVSELLEELEESLKRIDGEGAR